MCGCLLLDSHWAHGLQCRHVPRLGIEPATLWSVARIQSTELHKPGLQLIFNVTFGKPRNIGQCHFYRMSKGHNVLRYNLVIIEKMNLICLKSSLEEERIILYHFKKIEEKNEVSILGAGI